jgi:hypothetical protein
LGGGGETVRWINPFVVAARWAASEFLTSSIIIQLVQLHAARYQKAAAPGGTPYLDGGSRCGRCCYRAILCFTGLWNLQKCGAAKTLETIGKTYIKITLRKNIKRY